MIAWAIMFPFVVSLLYYREKMTFALSQIFITRAQTQDAARLTEIAFAAKRHWNYPESRIQHWGDALTITRDFIATHETFSAVLEGNAIGFYALRQKNDRMDLLHLWVLPEWMRRGVGRLLFQHAIEQTAALGFREIEIESDPNAEGFYLKLGARKVGTNIHTSGPARRELPVLIYESYPSAVQNS